MGENDPGKRSGPGSALCDTAESINPDMIILRHGGRISVHRVYDASGVERLRAEKAFEERMEQFKAIRF